ncbi:MAG: DUF3662 and FHA domain-containing protein [Anaerolineales bacterium]
MLTERLRTLEKRLQSLFEEKLARLIPGENARVHLQAQLIARLNLALAQSAGRVPRRLRISVPPNIAERCLHDPLLHQAIEQILYQAIQESGLECPTPPQVEINSDATLPGNGMRLTIPETGPLEETEAYPALPDNMPHPNLPPGDAFLIVGGKYTYLLTKAITNIGRRPDNDLVIGDPRVSRAHAQLRAERGQYYLFDLNATGGTFVNGRRILQYQLHPGDVISLAGYPLVFGLETPDVAPDETQEYIPPTA